MNTIELMKNVDARIWAEQFIVACNNPAGINPEQLTGWFANAFMSGYDRAKNEVCRSRGSNNLSTRFTQESTSESRDSSTSTLVSDLL